MAKKKKKAERRDSEDGEDAPGVFVERDLENDVPRPACVCGKKALRRERYRPHLCPMEIRNKCTIFEGLEGVRAGQLVEDQVFRHVESKLPPDDRFRDQLVSVPLQTKPREWCEQQLAEYDALLERHEQALHQDHHRSGSCHRSATDNDHRSSEAKRADNTGAADQRIENSGPRGESKEGDRDDGSDDDLDDCISLPALEDPCKDENLALPYTRRAALLLALGRYEEALESAQMASTLNVHLASAFYQWGLAAYYLGDFAAAADAMLQGLRYNPRNPRLDRAVARLRVLL